jgi:iron complex transport system substrate-binding protein
MRICSFLPSGTEILFALGLGDSVVGVTFECDYPAEVRTKAVVVYTKLPPGLPEHEIDRQVNEFSSRGRSLYRLHAEKLRELKPDLIVTQDLCHVCAASPDDLTMVLGTLSPCPQVLALSPRTIADVWNDIITVGHATGRTGEASALVANLEQKIAQVRKNQIESRPRVLCLEWLDPPFAAGHWVPEMVELAGGIDVLGRAGEPGAQVSWSAIEKTDPDVILAMPCGYHCEEIETELEVVPFPEVWYSLRAVQNSRVFATDASSHFSRPGPRLADGVVALTEIFRQQTHAQPKKSPSANRGLDRPARAGRR